MAPVPIAPIARYPMARSWLNLAPSGHSRIGLYILHSYSSSSGGGLPGRPATRKSPDAC
jgi:hypothetical protein